MQRASRSDDDAASMDVTFQSSSSDYPAAQPQKNRMEYVKALFVDLEELKRLFPDTVQEVGKDLDRVNLHYDDSEKRRHTMRLQFKAGVNYLEILTADMELPPTVVDQFPVPIHNQCTSNNDDVSEPNSKRFKSSPADIQDLARKNLPQLEALFQSTLGDDRANPAPAGNVRIVQCYKEFCKRVGQLQDFWKEMEDLDGHCCVVEEPETKINRATTSRTIRVDDDVTLFVDTNPLCPRQSPRNYKFHSSKADAASDILSRFEESLEAGLWNTERSLRENMEACLNVSLPSKNEPDESRTLSDNPPETTNHEESDGLECGICLAEELSREDNEDLLESVEVPSITCENQSCNRPYHPTCLHTWLDSLPSSRLAFDVLLGNCPYCKEPIACPIPD